MLTNVESYVLNHSVFNTFKKIPVIPVYLNWLNFQESFYAFARIDELASLSKTLRTCSSDKEAAGLFYNRLSKLCNMSSKHNIPKNIPTIFKTFSYGLISSRTQLALSENDLKDNHLYLLPVERFYIAGNYGSGRHVRLANIEIKGTGRNSCAVRDDWRHSWGGMTMVEIISEATLSHRINSIAPLGAVPVQGISLLAPSSSPLVMTSNYSDGPQRDILGQATRTSDYLRLSNIYFGPNSNNEQIEKQNCTSLEHIIEQYACLSAYGYFHVMPTTDNLTISGKLLDVCSAFSITPDPVCRMERIYHDATVFENLTKDKIIKLVQGGNSEELFYFHTAAAHLHAIRTISDYHKKLWKTELPLNWIDTYLTSVAFYWLIKKGIGNSAAMKHAKKIKHLFGFLVADTQCTFSEYISKNKKNLKIRKVGSMARIELNNKRELQELYKYLSSIDEFFPLIRRYNERNIANTGNINLFPHLRKSPSEMFNAIDLAINKASLTLRLYNTCSIANRQFDYKIRDLFNNKLSIESQKITQLLNYFEDVDKIKIAIAYQSKNKAVIRRKLPTECTKDYDCLKYRKPDPIEYIIEGLEVSHSLGTSIIPIPLIYNKYNKN